MRSRPLAGRPLPMCVPWQISELRSCLRWHDRQAGENTSQALKSTQLGLAVRAASGRIAHLIHA